MDELNPYSGVGNAAGVLAGKTLRSPGAPTRQDHSPQVADPPGASRDYMDQDFVGGRGSRLPGASDYQKPQLAACATATRPAARSAFAGTDPDEDDEEDDHAVSSQGWPRSSGRMPLRHGTSHS
jgi:hypothetical protein